MLASPLNPVRAWMSACAEARVAARRAKNLACESRRRLDAFEFQGETPSRLAAARVELAEHGRHSIESDARIATDWNMAPWWIPFGAALVVAVLGPSAFGSTIPPSILAPLAPFGWICTAWPLALFFWPASSQKRCRDDPTDGLLRTYRRLKGMAAGSLIGMALAVLAAAVTA